jgi:hypothetical protein
VPTVLCRTKNALIAWLISHQPTVLFLSEQTSQQYFSLRTNQQLASGTFLSQTNRLEADARSRRHRLAIRSRRAELVVWRSVIMHALRN